MEKDIGHVHGLRPPEDGGKVFLRHVCNNLQDRNPHFQSVNLKFKITGHHKLLPDMCKLEYTSFLIIIKFIFYKPHHHHHHHHHNMALQPKSGPDIPFWGFVTITFLQGWIVSPAPNPQPGRPGLRIYDPQRQGGPAIPLGTGYPF
jgi:hypothetical protein